MPNFTEIGQVIAKIAQFFKMVASRHLGFSNSINFNGRRVAKVLDVSPCQISSQLVQQLRRYCDFSIFHMAAGGHLLNSRNLNG